VEKKRYVVNAELRGQVQLLVWLAPIGLAFFVVIGLLNRPHTRGDWWSFGGIVAFFALAIPFALRARSATSAVIDVDDDAIEFRKGEEVVRIRWSEVTLVEHRRFARRLRVHSRSGAVIPIEEQVAGFAELAAIVAERTGRPLVPAPRKRRAAEVLPQERAIRVAAPRWLEWFQLTLLAAAAYWFSVRWLIEAWRQQRPMLVVVAIIGGWLVAKALRNAWSKVGQELRLDEYGIVFRDRRGEIRARWSDIGTARLEYPGGTRFFVVRDRANEPLLALQRELFNLSGAAMKRFDRLVETARERTGS
jgi:hypothetical protein